MFAKTKISVSSPYSKTPGDYFSFRLKHERLNERVEYDTAGKILVIAGIEGNFKAFRRILVKNKVIDRKYGWVFGNGHLVILGDCVDREGISTECLWLVYSLEDRARRQGGYVHFIFGNHEINSLRGNWRGMHPKYAVKSAGSKNPSTALYDGSTELWRWLITKNIMEKIGDTLLVHGGISPELLQYNLPIQEVNHLARSCYTLGDKQFTDPALHTLFQTEHSPFRYRGYYQNPISAEQVDVILRYFHVKTIVTGHTDVGKAPSSFDGRVVNVDASGNSQALLIKRNKFYCVDKEGKRERIK